MAYSDSDRVIVTDRPIVVPNDGITTLRKIPVDCSQITISNGMANVDVLTSEDVNDIIKDLIAKLSQTPILKHQCHSCGGTIEMDADNHLFRCPYCGSAYAIGTAMVHS